MGPMDERLDGGSTWWRLYEGLINLLPHACEVS